MIVVTFVWKSHQCLIWAAKHTANWDTANKFVCVFNDKVDGFCSGSECRGYIISNGREKDEVKHYFIIFYSKDLNNSHKEKCEDEEDQSKNLAKGSENAFHFHIYLTFFCIILFSSNLHTDRKHTQSYIVF